MIRKNNRNKSASGYKRTSGDSENKFSSSRPKRNFTGTRSSPKPDGDKSAYSKKSEESRSYSKPYAKRKDGDYSSNESPKKSYSGASKPFGERSGSFNRDEKPAYFKKRRPEFGEDASSRCQRKTEDSGFPRGKRPTSTFDSDIPRNSFGKPPHKKRPEGDSEKPRRSYTESDKPRSNRRFESDTSSSDPKSYLKKSFGLTDTGKNNTREEQSENQYKSPYASKGKTPNDDSRPSLFKRFMDNKITLDGDKRSKPNKPSENTYKSRTGKTERSHADGVVTNFENSLHAGQRLVRKSKSGSKKNVPSFSEDLRLNKYIAHAGICSRREADELIANGMISVNGKTITEMGYKVKQGDVVKYGRKILSPEKMVYVLLNKPKDFLTTTEDPEERRTVMELVKNACQERIYPVGRLDRNTTGLLLFTNDGELAERLTHPSYKCKKVYAVELDKPFAEEDGLEMLQGIKMDEGIAKVDSIATLSPDRRSVGLELHIGWNRIVRRLFEAKGYKVEKLDRVMYAGLTKKDLPRGHWRHLTEKEVIALKHF